MHLSTWLSFVISAIIIAISPGSGAVLSMSHGLAYGFKKSSATVLGLQCGLVLVLIVAGAGVGSLVLASDLLFTIVKTVGALYLIYLGIMQWRARVHTSDVARADLPPHPSFRQRVLTGFLTNASNPKGILFMAVVLPSFIAPAQPVLPQLAILGVTMVAIDTTVMHGYAFLASSMQRYFRDPRAVKKQNRFFGALLALMGLALFFVKRSSS
jgi:homoserine/homoserine lactone efflux protein